MKRHIKLSMLLIAVIFIISGVASYAGAGYVASVDGKGYASLQTAVNKAKSGQTITILKDVSTAKSVKVRAGKKTININFAGNQYKYTGSKSAFEIVSGTVNIRTMKITSKNNAFYIRRGGKVTLQNGSCKGYIVNKGKLTINGGVYSSKGAMKSKKDELIQNYKKLTINNGTFTGVPDNAVCSFKGTVLIKGGKFKCKKKDYPCILNFKKSKMTIRKGSYTSKGEALYNEGKLNMEGGRFRSYYGVSVINTGSMQIKGGIINEKKGIVALYNYMGNMTIHDVTLNGTVFNYTKKNKKLKIYGGDYNPSKGAVGVINHRGRAIIIYADIYTRKNNALLNEKKGKLTVYDGYFESTGGYYALQNEGKATLKGGSFDSIGDYTYSIHCLKGSTLTKSGGVVGKVTYD